MSYTDTHFRESVARYDALPPEQRPAVHFHRWSAAESRKLSKYLSTVFAKHKGSFLQTHLGLNEEGEVEEWHAVYAKDGTLLGAYDASRPCPPHCT
jgi:hypothetical protein